MTTTANVMLASEVLLPWSEYFCCVYDFSFWHCVFWDEVMLQVGPCRSLCDLKVPDPLDWQHESLICSFHLLSRRGAAILDFEVGEGQVPPTLWVRHPASAPHRATPHCILWTTSSVNKNRTKMELSEEQKTELKTSKICNENELRHKTHENRKL